MTTNNAHTTLLALALLCAAGVLVACAHAKSPTDGYAYPQYQGPTGNFRPMPATAPLTDNPNDVAMRWDGPYNMGIGKTGSQHLHYNYDRTAQGAGLKGKDDLVHGGANSLVAAEGKIFVSYFVGKPPYTKLKATGEYPHAPKTFFGIQADDVVVALDAETGEVVWKTVEENGGVQIGGGKRYNWHCSPAYVDGKVFTINPLEQVRCYDARTGKRLWQTEQNPKLAAVVAERLKTRAPMGYGAVSNKGITVFETSLMVAGDALVTPIGKVYDIHTGKLLWTDKDNLIGSQYTFWRHERKTYILTISGVDGSTLKGLLRLIEPRTGKLLWEYPVFSQGWPPLFLGDTCIALVHESKTLPGYARVAGLKLSADRRPVLLWELPDTLKTVVGYGPSGGVIRQGCVGDGIAVLMVRGISKGRYTYPKHKVFGTVPKSQVGSEIARLSKSFASLERDKQFMIVRLSDGKVLNFIDNKEAGEKILGFGNYFLDRTHLLMFGDTRHSGRFFTLQYYRVDPDSGDWKFLGRIPIGAKIITGYHTMMESPSLNGNVYMRTYKGVARYDFRRPDPSRTFTVRLSDILLGWEQRDLLLHFITSEDGRRIASATIRPAEKGSRDPSTSQALPLDCTGLSLSKQRLAGTIATSLRKGQEDLNTIEIDLSRSGDAGGWEGTCRRVIPPYDRPVKVSGAVSIKQAEAEGTMKTTLSLEGAIAPRGDIHDADKRRPVSITLMQQGGQTISAWAQAGRLNATVHEVSVDRWEPGKDRIRAIFTVIYHDDIHYHHNPETEGPTAARYTIDASRQDDGTFRGTHTGQAGVEHTRSGKVGG